MELKDLNNETLFRQYGFMLKEIENKYKQKKDFEEEIKRRFNEGILN